jgi:predicted permease
MMQGLMVELGVAVRALARRPAFGLCTAAVLAVGIAGVSTMFSALYAVVLRPLPYHEPDRLVWIYSSSEAVARNSTSALDYFDYRRQFRGFESVAAQLVFRPITYLTGDGEPEPLRFTQVSFNYFTTLGVRPALGRTFAVGEEEPSAPNVVVLSHGLWQRRLGGRPDAVGRTLTLDGAAYQVVGVMPPGIDFPSEVDLWRPMRRGEPVAEGRGNNNFGLFGRLRPGVSLESAQAEASVLAGQLERAYPENKGWGLGLLPMHEVFFGDYRPAMIRLMAAVLLLLLVTCANVSSLFLARAVSRNGELAVRLALGASRSRLAWHVLGESMLVAAAGGAAGLALSWGAVRGLRALAPAGLPRLHEIAVDGTVTLVTAGICMLAGLVAGVVPAVRGSRVAPADALGREKGVASGRGGSALRSGLVVVQVALSLVLLIGSTLMVKSFLALYRTDVGFSAANMLIADVRPPATLLEDGEKLARFYRDLTDRLRGTPGVKDVALAEQLPFLAGGMYNEVFAGDRPAPPEGQRLGAERRRVGDGHFRALGIAVLKGREILPSDTEGRPLVVVINQALADRLWPHQLALGKTLVLPWDPDVRLEVVGVVANIREFGPAADPRPTFYPPLAQIQATGVQVGVRTTGDPVAIVSLVKQAAREVAPDVAISAFQTMDTRFATRTAAPRFRTVLLAVFGVLALALAASGLFSLLSYLAAQRERELGIRLALGARQGAVTWLILRRGLALAAGGIAAGAAAGLALSGVMRSLLFQVSPTDLAAFGGASAALALVAVAACLLPAWRAGRLDPVVTLRRE